MTDIFWDEKAQAWCMLLPGDSWPVWGDTRREVYEKWLDYARIRMDARRRNPDLYADEYGKEEK